MLPAGEARSVQLDKRRIDLEASEEIRLTCGKSSLVLRRDGSVVVRGVAIVSRASQSNKSAAAPGQPELGEVVMPVTVGVNFLSVVHADSNGIATAFPDVCKTPSPAGPIPIPLPKYREVLRHGQWHDQGQVRRQSRRCKDSNFSMSTGDEAGSAGGSVVSDIDQRESRVCDVLDGREVRGQERLSRIRYHAAQRQEHAAVPCAAGTRRRSRAGETRLLDLRQTDLGGQSGAFFWVSRFRGRSWVTLESITVLHLRSSQSSFPDEDLRPAVVR